MLLKVSGFSSLMAFLRPSTVLDGLISIVAWPSATSVDATKSENHLAISTSPESQTMALPERNTSDSDRNSSGSSSILEGEETTNPSSQNSSRRRGLSVIQGKIIHSSGDEGTSLPTTPQNRPSSPELERVESRESTPDVDSIPAKDPFLLYDDGEEEECAHVSQVGKASYPSNPRPRCIGLPSPIPTNLLPPGGSLTPPPDYSPEGVQYALLYQRTEWVSDDVDIGSLFENYKQNRKALLDLSQDDIINLTTTSHQAQHSMLSLLNFLNAKVYQVI
ncbi:hypothetical protein EDD21DRAFT_421585 [Dissophora ornata]|nr:hypothetical protein EDD21DRAFT_421585 [Dissophora ornata]